MKILVDGLPRSIGGIGTLIFNIADYNRKIGNRGKIDFEFLLPEGSSYGEVLKQKEYRFYEMPKVLTSAYRKTILSVFQKNHFDFVWINNTSKVNLNLPLIAKKHGAQVIAHSHGVKTEATGLKKLGYSLLEALNGKKYCNLIDIPFACSAESADYFYPEKLRQRCVIVSNGIETERFAFNSEQRRTVRNKLGIAKETVLLGVAGRLTKVKNYRFAVRLMSDLPENYSLILIGEGEERKELEALVSKAHLEDRVQLLGQKNDVENYLCAMDAFLMPSLNEGMPFSLIEAQANGLFCLVSSGVSSACKLCDSVEFLDLEKADEWVSKIMSVSGSTEGRADAWKRIKEKGFSIEDSYSLFCSGIGLNK